MRYILFILMLAFSWAQAETVQWSQGYTADCDNPTARSDGSTLSLAEISHVLYQVIPAAGGAPIYEVIMQGGCKPTFVDTKSFLPVGDYLLHGITVDTDGQASVQSSPGIPMTVQKARPNPPSGAR